MRHRVWSFRFREFKPLSKPKFKMPIKDLDVLTSISNWEEDADAEVCGLVGNHRFSADKHIKRETTAIS